MCPSLHQGRRSKTPEKATWLPLRKPPPLAALKISNHPDEEGNRSRRSDRLPHRLEETEARPRGRTVVRRGPRAAQHGARGLPRPRKLGGAQPYSWWGIPRCNPIVSKSTEARTKGAPLLHRKFDKHAAFIHQPPAPLVMRDVGCPVEPARDGSVISGIKRTRRQLHQPSGTSRRAPEPTESPRASFHCPRSRPRNRLTGFKLASRAS